MLEAFAMEALRQAIATGPANTCEGQLLNERHGWLSSVLPGLLIFRVLSRKRHIHARGSSLPRF